MGAWDRLTEHVLVHYRWVLVVLFLLPASAVYDAWAALRGRLVFWLSSAPRAHRRKVARVQRQLNEWRASGGKTKLCTARPGWQTMSFRRPLYKDTFTNIEINLVDVLEVDTHNMTVRCEPMVTMGQLSAALAPLGLALAVVPEIDDLTVGGLVMGTGVETSSHVHGLFQHICTEYEMLMADGSVVTCSEDKYPDLFYAVPWSYGTLGFLLSAVIKVVPAKKYVRLEYVPCASLAELASRFTSESCAGAPRQFVEALLFSHDAGVLMLGDMADHVGDDGELNRIGDWHSEWFFKQVEDIMHRGRTVVQYIPLRHYYHRHTRSLFWELQDIIPFGNASWFRYTLGWLMPPKVSLLKATQTATVRRLYETRHVIQDMLLPIELLEEAVQVFHEEFEVYPVWLCPFKLPARPGQLRARCGEGGGGDAPGPMYVDIGTYGVPKAKCFETVRSTRRVEEYVMKNNGFQMLYADTYTTREEFRRMFDHALYDRVRASLPYCTDAFPEIYGKVNKSVRY